MKVDESVARGLNGRITDLARKDAVFALEHGVKPVLLSASR